MLVFVSRDTSFDFRFLGTNVIVAFASTALDAHPPIADFVFAGALTEAKGVEEGRRRGESVAEVEVSEAKGVAEVEISEANGVAEAEVSEASGVAEVSEAEGVAEEAVEVATEVVTEIAEAKGADADAKAKVAFVIINFVVRRESEGADFDLVFGVEVAAKEAEDSIRRCRSKRN